MARGSRNFLTLCAVLIALAFGYGLGSGLRREAPTEPISVEAAAPLEILKSAPPPPAESPPLPLPTSSRRDVVVDVAQRATPAVVTIGLTVVEPRERPGGLPVRSLLRPYADELFKTFTQGGSGEHNVPYVGSGFIIDRSSLLGPGFNPGDIDPNARYVLTNYHVISSEENPRIFVTLADGRELPAVLLDADTVVDLALLKLVTDDPESIPVMSVGDSDDLMVGETVIALGNPFGPMIEDPNPTVTIGVVSALHRSFQPEIDQSRSRPLAYRNMIQTDASINSGNSGGPLVNLDGEVIGINTFAISPQGSGSIGVNFATPINRAVDVAREIVRYGQVRPILIDVEVWAINRYLMGRYGLTETSGLFVWKVSAGGPAAAAGLRKGDVLLKVDGRRAFRPDDLIGTIYSRTVGEHINLTVSREGRTFETEYEVRQAPIERGFIVPHEPKTAH